MDNVHQFMMETWWCMSVLTPVLIQSHKCDSIHVNIRLCAWLHANDVGKILFADFFRIRLSYSPNQSTKMGSENNYTYRIFFRIYYLSNFNTGNIFQFYICIYFVLYIVWFWRISWNSNAMWNIKI
jgi:hypothetical protein